MFKIFSTYICWINIQNATLHDNGAVRPLYGSLGVKGLSITPTNIECEGFIHIFILFYYTLPCVLTHLLYGSIRLHPRNSVTWLCISFNFIIPFPE